MNKGRKDQHKTNGKLAGNSMGTTKPRGRETYE